MFSRKSQESSPQYPRTYRASGGWLIFLSLGGAVSALAGSIGAWWFVVVEPPRDSAGRFWLPCICCAFVALGVYLLLSVFLSRIVLFEDRIEVVELTNTKVLRREEIRGWKTHPAPGLVFFPKESARSPISFALLFPIDTTFAQWLYTLPCLDANNRKSSRAEIRNNTRLGSTPGVRMRALATGRRIALAINAVASLLSLWAFLRPVPYEPLMISLILSPWIAGGAVKLSRGLFRIDGFRDDDHPHVAYAILFPSMSLALRSLSDYDLLNSIPIAWCAVIAGILLWLLLCAIDPSSRAKGATAVAILAVSLGHGYGTAVQTNAMLDTSPEIAYDAVMKEKRVSSGKSITYQLDLAPWGPSRKETRIRVGQLTFQRVQPGDLIHLAVRKGALGARWYYLRSWERGAGSPTIPPAR
ncbi:hypothetical protein [Paludibaculum fermentans]|uniref:hypothetical protein n=1 Tax=Paludibaculum fermentans TaxID=1473598 RepID=UPI003EBB4A85